MELRLILILHTSMATRRKIGPDQEILGLSGGTVGDFWSWAYSDLLGNTIRPLFAEYLVARCLGATDRPRVEWDHIDFVYRGKKIEVKSAGYVQTWDQAAASVISFEIAVKERPWIADTNTFGAPGRPADCYVLCVHADVDRTNCVVNDVSRWEFYVIPTVTISATFKSQKTVRLRRIRLLCSPVKYAGLRQAIDSAIGIEQQRAAQATA